MRKILTTACPAVSEGDGRRLCHGMPPARPIVKGRPMIYGPNEFLVFFASDGRACAGGARWVVVPVTGRSRRPIPPARRAKCEKRGVGGGVNDPGRPGSHNWLHGQPAGTRLDCEPELSSGWLQVPRRLPDSSLSARLSQAAMATSSERGAAPLISEPPRRQRLERRHRGGRTSSSCPLGHSRFTH